MRRFRYLFAFGVALTVALLDAAELSVHRNLKYAGETATSSQSLDVYAGDAQDKPKPVMVFIHGGAWRIGDKWLVNQKPRAFIDHGFVFVSINYRLNADTSPREQGVDVARAVRWVHDHIEEYGGDPGKIFLMGHSAGAHLAALVSIDDRLLRGVDLPLSTIKGTVLIDGAAYDVPNQLELAPLSRLQEMYRNVFSDDVEQQRDASPITHVARDKGIPPFLILHVASRVDGRLQAEALGATLQAAGVSAKVVGFAGKNHLTINRDIGRSDDPPTEEVFQFLDRLTHPRDAVEPASEATSAKTDQTYDRSLVVDGRERTWRLFVPASAKRPAALVFALHGGGGNARQMERYTGFNEVARRDGFLVLYPDAHEGNWNDGRDVEFLAAQKNAVDDVRFLREALQAADRLHPVDRSRVYATGISNGAFLSHRLATEASDLVAAIAPVVGGMAPAMGEKFNPPYPVSILIIQGTADPLVPIDGGDVGPRLGRSRGKTLPTEATLARYVERNGNKEEPEVTHSDDVPDDGTSIEKRRWPPGPGGVRTEYRRILDGGHAWPGKPPYASERLIGKASQEFDATTVIWEFFKSCPPRTRADAEH